MHKFLLLNHLKCAEDVLLLRDINYLVSISSKYDSASIYLKKEDKLIILDGQNIVLYNGQAKNIVYQDYFSRGAVIQCINLGA